MTKRILIVDDCRLTLEIARDMVTSAGCEAVTARSAIEANRHLYCATPPDMMLIDVEMPLISGDKTICIYKSDERLKHIHTVIMSQKTAGEMEALRKSSGADSYIMKPLTKATLLEQIKLLQQAR